MIYSCGISNTQLQPIFREIVWQKRLEIAQLQQEMSLASLQRQLTAAPTVRDFFSALQQSPHKPSIIAEVNKALPNQGIIRADFEPVEIALAYEKGGASCISVVTDQKFYQGSFEYLRAIRYQVPLPLLCKDFILDPCQIYLARASGADGVLLISAILSDRQIQNFLRVIHYLGMNAVVEVHNESELDRMLNLEDLRIISINNRNLQDLNIDINTTKQLLAARRSHLQDLGILVLSESGIETSADLALLANAGTDGVIIGEPLLRQNQDVEKAVRSLLKPHTPVFQG
jgi:indole-3-glycerol phosphate synthase